MFDLDLKDFGNRNMLDAALKNTLKKLSKSFQQDVCPTILWTGNGYHIYQPIEGFVLEREQIFFDFTKYLKTDLTTEFMRFAKTYFTDNKNDGLHNPSIKSCMVRIPGTKNSKNMQYVKIIQKWNGKRPHINYVLREFRRHLIQKRFGLLNKKNRKANELRKGAVVYNINWVEKLLQTPIEDSRKYCLWRILIPYLKNIKKLDDQQIITILQKWLDGCNRRKKLDFDSCQKIKENIKYVKGYLPISKTRLSEEHPEIYNYMSPGHNS